MRALTVWFASLLVALSLHSGCPAPDHEPAHDDDAPSDDDTGADDDDSAADDDDDSADACAPMDAQEGPDTCDGGGTGYRWDGSDCVYQGDLCNCVGSDCDALFDTREACLDAFADCH